MRVFICLLALLALSVSPASAKPDADNILILTLPTGDVEIEMKPTLAPRHVAQVKQLTRDGFYNGLAWFRVIDGFMAQTGYPKGKKGGKSDLPDLPAEFGGKFKRGTVGMGHGEDPNSANSQFFICFTDNGCKDLTGSYTAWGQVISGMEHIDALKRGEPPKNPDETVRARIAADATTPAEDVKSPAKQVGNQ